MRVLALSRLKERQGCAEAGFRGEVCREMERKRVPVPVCDPGLPGQLDG